MRLDDFDAFFAAVNDAHEPFAWQRRLCERVAQEGRWPDQIVAPTGTGNRTWSTCTSSSTPFTRQE